MSYKLVPASLDDVIKSAPPESLRDILTFICKRNDFARKFTESRLLTPLHIPDTIGLKRKVFEVCVKCKASYNVLQNTEDACVYHSGRSQNNVAQCKIEQLMVDLIQAEKS